MEESPWQTNSERFLCRKAGDKRDNNTCCLVHAFVFQREHEVIASIKFPPTASKLTKKKIPTDSHRLSGPLESLM